MNKINIHCDNIFKGTPFSIEDSPQKITYDMNTFEAIKNELKVATPSEFLYKQP